MYSRIIDTIATTAARLEESAHTIVDVILADFVLELCNLVRLICNEWIAKIRASFFKLPASLTIGGDPALAIYQLLKII
jgi:hypothetical protein